MSQFTNSKGIVGDPKLAIVYNLYNADGTLYSFTGIVTTFNPSTFTISVGTSNSAYPRVNPMKIVAYFTYNPSYTVEVSFNVILDKCFTTSITKSPNPNIVYQIGDPSITDSITSWSNTYGADCLPFTYTAIISPSTTAITFNPVI